MPTILLVEMMRRQLNTAEEEVQHHPPSPLRLKLVRRFLNKLGISTNDFEHFFEVYEFDYARKLASMSGQDRRKKATVSANAEKLLLSIADTVATKVISLGLSPFSKERARTAMTLEKKLHAGLPVSSIRETSNPEIFKSLDRLSAGAQRHDVYNVLSTLDEAPTNSAEILTAGWLYKLATFPKALLAVFDATDKQTDSCLDGYDKYLAETDALLLKSLELAAVQAVLSRSPGGGVHGSSRGE